MRHDGRKVKLYTASGARLATQKIGKVPNIGNVVVAKDVQDALFSVQEMCRNNEGASFVFKKDHARLHHPNLEEDIIAWLNADNQYILKGEDFARLMAAPCQERALNVTVTESEVESEKKTTEEPSDELSKLTIDLTTGPESDMPKPTDDAMTGSEATPAMNPSELREAHGGTVQEQPNKPEVILSKEQVRRANTARHLHICLGHPSDERLIESLTNGVITGTTLTAQDVKHAALLLGDCVACAVGKTVAESFHISDSEPTVRVGQKVYIDVFPLYSDNEVQHLQYGQYKSMILSVDSYSNMLHITRLNSKHNDDVNNALEVIIAEYKRYGHTIEEIISDSEPTLKASNTFLGLRGIKLRLTPPHMHNRRLERQVRTVKQRMRALRSASQVDIPYSLDGEIAKTAVMLINDMTNSKFKTQSPRMMFEGRRLDLSQRSLIPVGTVCQIPTPEDKIAKSRMGVSLGPAELTYSANKYFMPDTGIMVTAKRADVLQVIPADFPWKVKTGARNYTITKKIRKKQIRKNSPSDNVTTQAVMRQRETTNPTLRANKSTSSQVREGENGSEVVRGENEVEESEVNPGLPNEESNIRVPMRQRQDSPPQPLQVERPRMMPTNTTKPAVESMAETRARMLRMGYDLAQREKKSRDDEIARLAELVSENIPVTEPVNSEKTPPPQNKAIPTHSHNTRHSSRNKINEIIAKASKKCFMSKTEKGIRRRMRRHALATFAKIQKVYRISVKESLEGEHAQESKEAIIGEIQNMLNYSVGHYVNFNDIPKDKRGNILQSFMFLKHKTTPDGRYDKTKARMVGNGATQKDHMYDLVSSSTVALSSVLLLVNLASYYKAKLTTYDIKGAFLNAEFGEKDEVTYIRINKEITALWVEQDPTSAAFVDERGTLLLELDKFIYGLKQSPLKFQLHLRETLVELGYKPLSSDECLYCKHDGKDFSVLSTHVDDILQVATAERLYAELKRGLIAKYTEITTTDDGNAYLGMSIERSECRRHIKLSQRGLIDKVIERYPKAAGDLHKYHSPASDELFDVTTSPEARTIAPAEKTDFLSGLMTLMYIARLTRPDLLMPVTFLASRTHCATNRDVAHLHRVVRYLENTKEMGIHIFCESLQVHCKCDAAFAAHSPQDQAKGQTGFVLGLGRGMSYVHSRSGKQKTASTSSTDAEIIALCEALKMCVWMREIIRELGITDLEEIVIQQDNKSVIMMSSESTTMKRSKHLSTKLTYIKSLVLAGALRLEYLNTADMTADVLSKPLHGEAFYKHVTDLLGLRWSKYVNGKATVLGKSKRTASTQDEVATAKYYKAKRQARE